MNRGGRRGGRGRGRGRGSGGPFRRRDADDEELDPHVEVDPRVVGVVDTANAGRDIYLLRIPEPLHTQLSALAAQAASEGGAAKGKPDAGAASAGVPATTAGGAAAGSATAAGIRRMPVGRLHLPLDVAAAAAASRGEGYTGYTGVVREERYSATLALDVKPTVGTGGGTTGRGGGSVGPAGGVAGAGAASSAAAGAAGKVSVPAGQPPPASPPGDLAAVSATDAAVTAASSALDMYDLSLHSNAHGASMVLTSPSPFHPTGDCAVAGTVRITAVVKPAQGSRHEMLARARVAAAAARSRTALTMDEGVRRAADVVALRPVSLGETAAAREERKRRAEVNRRTVGDEPSGAWKARARSGTFAAFERQEYWSMAELADELDLPLVRVKAAVSGLVEYVKRGSNVAKYQLKDQYLTEAQRKVRQAETAARRAEAAEASRARQAAREAARAAAAEEAADRPSKHRRL
ncbi:hypothetical protein MMPV_002562 [Pyropia vietnamensis]